ncbi:antitoxin of toxin-antitoxin stability system [Sphingobium sp. BYY-5]|uniref:CopG family ribbon-helix-helix protein n=1 Tax=Sphingobium sp. BYY-5 TaxID=2926400 RepID=UPI001FA792C2|nr:antitoxin of toxin-antitoxin stability system [Sphingobium sp. BYY-5]MCI4592411.1 antitoxin of toxin-antitoxin stability system [Sphingobium sp. BYY-5]
MNEATFTFRVDEQLKSQFARVAKARDRSGAQLLRDFMRDVVRHDQLEDSHDAWFRRQVEAGRVSAQDGAMTSGEDVEAHFAARRAATLRKIDSGE